MNYTANAMPSNDNSALADGEQTNRQGPVPALSPEGLSPASPSNSAFIDVGETLETSQWRVHRAAHSLTITCLEFAGKVGKKVYQFCIYNLDLNVKSHAQVDICTSQLRQGVHANMSVDQMAVLVAGIGGDLCSPVSFRTLRGVDVIPSAASIQINTGHAVIKADPLSFCIECIEDRNNLPTAISTRRSDARRFYNWAKAHDFTGLRYNEILAILKAAGVHYHRYCAMD